MRGEVKLHDSEPAGTVIRLDAVGGFGFLESWTGAESTFTGTACSTMGFLALLRVLEEAGEKGAQASTVKLLGRHALR
jgi:hypothetical protein